MSDSPGRAGILEKSPQKLHRRTLAVGFVLLCLIAGALFYRQILWELGAMLVNSGSPEHADIAVTLAGDVSGNRILKAAELVREGYVAKVLVSGAAREYGVPESAMAIGFAVDHGYPRDYFIPLQTPSLSTREEAVPIVAALRKLGVHKVLLVTSYFHTARAGRILRRTAPELEFHIAGARAPHWNDGYWWKEREGEKIWLEETAKTVADFFGI